MLLAVIGEDICMFETLRYGYSICQECIVMVMPHVIVSFCFYICLLFQNLKKLDAQFKENYSDLISRFYIAYESIYKYAIDLNSYIKDLSDGVYFQHSLDNVFADADGKQLMVSRFDY